MQFLVLLLVNNLVMSKGYTISDCDGVTFFNKFYSKEQLYTSVNQASKLVVPMNSHNLFFSYVDWNRTDPGFRIKVCNIYKKSCNEIQEIRDGHAIGYDRMRNLVFFGGKGIYKYNSKTKKAEIISNYQKVMHIFLNHHFFIISQNALYVLKNGTFIEVPEMKGIQVLDFFVSKDLSIYFTNTTGLYKIDKPGSLIYLLSDTIRVTQITQDYGSGGVFFSAYDGIYIDDVSQRKIRKVADVDFAFGLAFWNGSFKKKKSHLIYSVSHSIYMLKPSKNSEFCLQMKMYNVTTKTQKSKRVLKRYQE